MCARECMCVRVWWGQQLHHLLVHTRISCCLAALASSNSRFSCAFSASSMASHFSRSSSSCRVCAFHRSTSAFSRAARAQAPSLGNGGAGEAGRGQYTTNDPALHAQTALFSKRQQPLGTLHH